MNHPEISNPRPDSVYNKGAWLDPELEKSTWDMVYNKQIAMWWSHGGWISRFAKAAPSLNYTVGLMPKNKTRRAYIASQAWMINGKTKNPDQAWEYIKWFTSREGEAMFAPFEGHVSVWEQNWTLPVYKHPGYQGLINQLKLPDTKPFQIHPGWVAVRAGIAREIQKILFKKTSIDEGLAAAQKAAEKELADLK